MIDAPKPGGHVSVRDVVQDAVRDPTRPAAARRPWRRRHQRHRGGERTARDARGAHVDGLVRRRRPAGSPPDRRSGRMTAVG